MHIYSRNFQYNWQNLKISGKKLDKYKMFLFDFIAVLCYTKRNSNPLKTITEVCFFREVSESRCMVRTGTEERKQSHS